MAIHRSHAALKTSYEVARKVIGMTYDECEEYFRYLWEVNKKAPVRCFAVLDGKRTLWKPHKNSESNLVILCSDENDIIYKAFVGHIPEEELASLPKRQ